MKTFVREWLLQSITAIILVPLFLYSVFTFIEIIASGGTYDAMVTWVKAPCVSITLLLTTAVGFYHAALGMRVIIDDYVHHEFLRVNSIRLFNLFALVMALAGIGSILKIISGA